MTLYIITYSG